MPASITTILSGVHYVIPAQEVQEAYNYLQRQKPNQVAKILVDWYAPIRNGCTNQTFAESVSMIELISRFLWEVCASGFSREVMDELASLAQWELIESVDARYTEWEMNESV